LPAPIKFRQEALKQLTSPEQLDQLIQVVTPRSWLIAGTLYLILFLVLVWSIVGSIPTRIEGQGILLSGGGDIYNAVAPEGSGYISNLLVKQGDTVQKGQVIAILSRPDLLDQIKVMQNYLIDLQQKQIKLLSRSKTEIAERQKEIQTQKESLQRRVVTTQEKYKHLGELLAIKRAAFSKGIETRQNLEATFQEYYNVQGELESYTDKLVELDIAQSNFLDQWRERLRQLSLKITDETVKIKNLQDSLKNSRNVSSPISGIVTDLRVTIGSIVNTGVPMISIASEGKGLDASIYLPPKAGKLLKIGMKALVEPNIVEKAEYGSIYGSVIYVSEFPITSQSMIAGLQNEELVKQFSHEEAPIAVRIHLENDPKTVSGLKWSSSNGPPLQITPGTLVKAMIIVRHQAPITLVIPALKKMVGVE
jgi:HlyD family secretion protein